MFSSSGHTTAAPASATKKGWQIRGRERAPWTGDVDQCSGRIVCRLEILDDCDRVGFE